MTFGQIKEQLTIEDIVKILQYFYPDIEVTEFDGGIILPTICHNTDIDEASHKLYYYENTKLFFCYTHCDSSFDIFDLIKKILDLRDLQSSAADVLNIVYSSCNITNINFDGLKEDNEYLGIVDKFKKKNKNPLIRTYDERVLNLFEESYPKVWLEEGISISSMQKFEIKMHPRKEQIVIPHRDVKGRLIGIRVRNLDPRIIENTGKYMPVKIENHFYSHPLMYNLYGLNINQAAIKTFKTAWIFEGEKSVLKCDAWYPGRNLAVASCGNKINKIQIDLLVRLGVQNIILCYDRMNYNNETDKAYFSLLRNMCLKYKQYVNISFVYDREYLLDFKQAPVDSGKEIFEKLLREKVNV